MSVENVGRVVVSWDLAMEFMPPGTEIKSIGPGWSPRTLEVVFRHPDLRVIVAGEEVPLYQIIATRIEATFEEMK